MNTNKIKRINNTTLLLDKVTEQLKRSNRSNESKSNNKNNEPPRFENHSKSPVHIKSLVGDVLNVDDLPSSDGLDVDPPFNEKILYNQRKVASPVINKNATKHRNDEDDSFSSINEDAIQTYLHKLRRTKHQLKSDKDEVHKSASSISLSSESKVSKKQEQNKKKVNSIPPEDRHIQELNEHGHSRVSSVLNRVSLLQDKYTKSKEKFQLSLPSQETESISSDLSDVDKDSERLSFVKDNLNSSIENGELLHSVGDLQDNSEVASLQQVFSVTDLLTAESVSEDAVAKEKVVEFAEETENVHETPHDAQLDKTAESISSNVDTEDELIQEISALSSELDRTESKEDQDKHGNYFFQNVRLSISLSRDDEESEVIEKTLSHVEELLEAESISENPNYSESFSSVSLISKKQVTEREIDKHSSSKQHQFQKRKKDGSFKTIAVQTSIVESTQTKQIPVLNLSAMNISIPDIPVMQPVYNQTIANMLIKSGRIEALSSYDPGLAALNELMRKQMFLTKQFTESQKQIYLSQINSLTPDYRYTSWDDTQQLINKKKHEKFSRVKH